MKKDVFLSATQALYKKGETDVADHLKTVEGEEIDDNLVLKIFKQLDAEKVTTFKNEATERFNNGVKKGQKDTAEKFEKKLRAAFNIEDETLIGEELLDHIENNLPEPGKAGDGKLDLSKITPEQLATIPAYIQKQREFNKQIKDKETEKETAVKAEQEKQTTAQLIAEASNKALAILDGRNPVLPKDAAKATTMKNKLLVEELKNHKFMKGTDGSLIPLDAEGKQAQDANGNPLDFATLVNGIVESNFEFNTSEERRSPENNNNNQQRQQQQQQKKVWTGKAPANQTEYTEMLLSEDYDTDQKVALKDTYSEQFGG